MSGARVRILIAGGGTGGHVFPAIALGGALRSRGMEVHFVGTAAGRERSTVPAAGFPLHILPGAQVRGGGIGRALRGGIALAHGALHARQLLRRLQPRLAVGVGGYASVSAVIAARLAGVPVVLLEQNAVPGAANRLLGRLASSICLGFAEAAPFFPRGRTVHTGNPIRPEVLAVPSAAGHARPGLLIFGGSQGARRLNAAAVEALRLLGPRAHELSIVHQTGPADRDRVAAAYGALGLRARVEAFIEDMGAAYRAADLVVSRAGAMSCAEITAMGLASVLVPYPWAADDHQRRNAEVLVAGGAARMLLDCDCDGVHLARLLEELLGDEHTRAEMARRAAALGRPDAAARSAEVCIAALEHRIA